MSTSPPVKHTNFQPKSIFNPTHAKGPYVQSFYRVVYSVMLRMPKYQKTFCTNLTPSDTESHHQLSHNFDLIIKPADKGGAIIVKDKSDYLVESTQLLSNQKTYKRLRSEPLPQFKIEAHSLINRAS